MDIEVAGSLPSLNRLATADPYCVSDPLSEGKNGALETKRKESTTNDRNNSSQGTRFFSGLLPILMLLTFS